MSQATSVRRPSSAIGLALLFLICLSACAPTASSVPTSQGGGARTPVPPYRQTLEEFNLSVLSCIQDKGYMARLGEEGAFMIDGVTDAQAVSADLRACKEAIDPARLEPPPPLTATQLEQMYRYLIAQVACMRDAGYPASDPPPFQVYVDTDRAFDPYGDLRQRGVEFSHADLIRCQHVDERPDFLDF